ncbi:MULTISPECIES: cytochrome-c peroxidase [unclassified Mesorhizobium]|uniref:cytochrome-c peroxidase n=1 Tax=unclassified Mesorhizobium TaxID=325217 RepID=UPI000BB05C9F|nr:MULTISPECIES: cytochrome-c peroxidase [unclassified Mesorhizobium]TGT61080.1 cytochrome-c peroxidase [Mesorhizobium sp. M00.F.Ca.ET.170.01.1.1]AZO08850.1 cytochrome-c peroxidase [Mesorhizobium sp. M3A.F.Ca.ET.080.04.2.1]PBB84287.1 cytochrome-c peroxidase [Mesorhizobium sp. WSM3876]RWB67446.1 MAG: cytochrome-c peroxidase [Mesorhizobium sp.]RWB84682.1 MAG: cytochrome-c peroxidase [Mesorhizobium sp.]
MTTKRWKSQAIAVAAVTIFGVALPANTAPAGSVKPGPMSRAEAFARAEALTALGRRMFFDPSLSASGKQACSSCHDPNHAFGPASAAPVEMGGPNLDQPGQRAVPSLRYLQAAPAFTEHFYDSEDEGDESVDNGPTGGLTWDGRADHGKDQARIPLLSPFEMGNKDEAQVVAALGKAPYAEAFKAAFGADVFEHPQEAFDAAIEALGTFEQSSADFYPYSSRYDAFLAGKATLTAQELRGRALFEDESKGNCASCHLSEPANNGEPPQFTDFGLIAIGMPRNPAIAANADPNHFDLGLCGPLRTDFKGRSEYCGLFKTPTLRNVALRKSFFHNGHIHTLREAVAFYASRDSDPGRWYPKNADGTVNKFDDLPKAYWGNLNTDLPFDGRKPGDKPALTDAEIDDIVAFLGTLTDADQAGQ